MAITFIKNNQEIPPPAGTNLLQLYGHSSGQAITLEWIDGQYWLHSDQKGELPIGVRLDRELERHILYFKKSSVHKELLGRAIGIKGAYRPKLLDLSAGLLGDSLLFLSMGCEVVALERHPVVAFLIQSALENAHHPLLEKFIFKEVSAAEYLEGEFPLVDVMFYDPMFEDANERALPRKEMRIFRGLIGQDTDAAEIAKLALKHKPKRVVIKRPRYSVSLISEKALVYPGKATRYDVYLSQNHGPNVSNQIK